MCIIERICCFRFRFGAKCGEIYIFCQNHDHFKVKKLISKNKFLYFTFDKLKFFLTYLCCIITLLELGLTIQLRESSEITFECVLVTKIVSYYCSRNVLSHYKSFNKLLKIALYYKNVIYPYTRYRTFQYLYRFGSVEYELLHQPVYRQKS